jgi:hypothetical protein
LGVVPISGMIVGYFYRHENELLTVLDVWGHLAANEPRTSVRLSLPVCLSVSIEKSTGGARASD